MIRYTEGNLLEADVEALVNTVNEVGVMGKGIALMFREAFPDNMAAYATACKQNRVRVGRMFVTENRALTGPKWIINFPTKKHWRHPTQLKWVQDGLKDLVRVIKDNGIQSIALPPLGCGNGGLDWSVVQPEIEAALAPLSEVDVLVFAPTRRYQNVPKAKGVQDLTPARAMILELIRRYSVLGIECSNLEVQKLAWFLQRSIEGLGLPNPLRLRFSANRYGPYADNLRHLLDGLDGSYLHCDKRLGDAGPFDSIHFEYEKSENVRNFLRGESSAPYAPAMDRATAIIDGFESPLGMELLSTVDWLLANGCAPNRDDILLGLEEWPGGASAGERKLRIFDGRMINLAIERLAEAPS